MCGLPMGYLRDENVFYEFSIDILKELLKLFMTIIGGIITGVTIKLVVNHIKKIFDTISRI